MEYTRPWQIVTEETMNTTPPASPRAFSPQAGTYLTESERADFARGVLDINFFKDLPFQDDEPKTPPYRPHSPPSDYLHKASSDEPTKHNHPQEPMTMTYGLEKVVPKRSPPRSSNAFHISRWTLWYSGKGQYNPGDADWAIISCFSEEKIPLPPRQSTRPRIFANGMMGIHDYTWHPQWFEPNRPYMAWIPLDTEATIAMALPKPVPSEPGKPRSEEQDIAFASITPLALKGHEGSYTVAENVAFLLHRSFCAARDAAMTMRDGARFPAERDAPIPAITFGDQISRKLLAGFIGTQREIIDLTTVVRRCILELRGYSNYRLFIRNSEAHGDALGNPNGDVPRNLRGAFTTDDKTAIMLHTARVPFYRVIRVHGMLKGMIHAATDLDMRRQVPPRPLPLWLLAKTHSKLPDEQELRMFRYVAALAKQSGDQGLNGALQELSSRGAPIPIWPESDSLWSKTNQNTFAQAHADAGEFDYLQDDLAMLVDIPMTPHTGTDQNAAGRDKSTVHEPGQLNSEASRARRQISPRQATPSGSHRKRSRSPSPAHANPDATSSKRQKPSQKGKRKQGQHNVQPSLDRKQQRLVDWFASHKISLDKRIPTGLQVQGGVIQRHETEKKTLPAPEPGWTPPVCKVWHSAVQAIDCSHLHASAIYHSVPEDEKSRMQHRRVIEQNGAVPLPHIIYTRADRMWQWMRLRTVWLQRLDDSPDLILDASIFTHAWRSFLSGAIWRQEDTPFELPCKQLAGVDPTEDRLPQSFVPHPILGRSRWDPLSNSAAIWHGTLYSEEDIKVDMAGNAQICAQVLWELAEVAFRTRFRELDLILAKMRCKNWDIDGPKIIEDRSALHVKAWGSVSFRPMLSEVQSMWERSDTEQEKALHGYWALIKDWPGSHDIILTDNILQTRDAILKYICQTMYDFFGVPPIVPRTLPPIKTTMAPVIIQPEEMQTSKGIEIGAEITDSS